MPSFDTELLPIGCRKYISTCGCIGRLKKLRAGDRQVTFSSSVNSTNCFYLFNQCALCIPSLFTQSSFTLLHLSPSFHCTENQIYVFPGMKLHGLASNSYIHFSVRNLYIPRTVPIWLQQNKRTYPGNI